MRGKAKINDRPYAESSMSAASAPSYWVTRSAPARHWRRTRGSAQDAPLPTWGDKCKYSALRANSAPPDCDDRVEARRHEPEAGTRREPPDRAAVEGCHATGSDDFLPLPELLERLGGPGAWHDCPMLFTLRAATAADIDGILKMWQEAAENAARPPDTREAVTALLGRDPDAVILADHDGELIGSVIAGWDGWRCHLYRLAVRPAWRRSGVGSALLRAAEDRFKALGAAGADAMVLDSNDLGQYLWRANGYRRQDDWRRWVKGLR